VPLWEFDVDNDTLKTIIDFARSKLEDPDVTSESYLLEPEEGDLHIVVIVTRNKIEATCVYESAGAISKAMPPQRGK
jgi:hypothetical protein